ncbi:DoxX family protein [Mucilaginibacter auburnensis]|uniref:Putative membrane protein YphA (DoxX/SURF4 family) n=1 Tax=Mucilaginibacter auburnensis TaxID=1457233 RepID=A0A2H9VP30_9SPHI|nr:DoxX family protein [Mucilaginibacter auburnensis]PJJ80063.1 putative membrane protein YphA (DoxX/SURF4 family) [Mucilaginibacter auburnensis]
MNLLKLITTDNAPTTLLIRLVVGGVFLSEGIQKFLFAKAQGVGRFEKIGLPNAEVLGPFVGTTEIICGLLILIGLLTRFAAIPLIIIMLVAITTTKIPMLEDGGICKMLHESRTDWAMLLCSIFLLMRGGGAFSLDRRV